MGELVIVVIRTYETRKAALVYQNTARLDQALLNLSNSDKNQAQSVQIGFR